MPFHRGKKDGKPYVSWGKNGPKVKYPANNAKRRAMAEKQAKALAKAHAARRKRK